MYRQREKCEKEKVEETGEHRAMKASRESDFKRNLLVIGVSLFHL